MRRFLSRRLAGMVGVLLATCLITFAIFFIFPANPAQQVCGRKCTPQIIHSIDKQWGLNKPLYEQFGEYVKGIVAGRTYGKGANSVTCPAPCLGFSFQNNLPVTTLIGQRLPTSVSIAVGAAVIWLFFGVGIGLLGAIRRDTWLDKTVTTVALGGIAAPGFLVAMLLLYLCCAKFQIMPYPSYTPFTQNPLEWLKGLILPWITLALYYAAVYARYTRASMIEVLDSDFITTARAKGLRERRVLLKHGMRAGVTPVLTIFGMDIAALLGGSVLIEKIFGLQGVGILYLQSIGAVDIPTVMGITLLVAFFVVAANIVVDVLYAVIDPKVRLA